MKLADIIVLAVIGGILGLAALYIVRAKKKGQKCIGCPHSGACPSKGGCHCKNTD